MTRSRQEIKQKKGFKPLRSAKLLLGLIVVIFVMSISFVFAGNYFCKHEALFLLAEKSAKTEFETVKSQLKWHLKKKGLFGWGITDSGKTSQDLPNEGEDLSLIKLPPCKLAREVLQYKTESSNGCEYKFSSPQPLNLNNMTNSFEQNALLQFKQGRKFVSRKLTEIPGTRYQVVFPIKSENSCLSCHTISSEYDNLLGTFSVVYDMDKWSKNAPSLTKQTVALTLLLIAAMVIIIYLFTQKTYATKVTVKTKTRNATADTLTGLLNRTALFEFIEREIMRARRFKDKLCLVLIDIDHFSQINDRYGSKMGDAVLIATSQILESQVREYDIIGRSGSNEFLLLLPQTSMEIAKEICSRLITMTEKTPVTCESHTTPVTVSTGLVEFRAEENEDIDMFIRRAKGALSNAKANGGNRMETDDVFRIKR